MKTVSGLLTVLIKRLDSAKLQIQYYDLIYSHSFIKSTLSVFNKTLNRNITLQKVL